MYLNLHGVSSKRKLTLGFTLIEMLVVAPFVILLIGTTISVISTLTGDSLKVLSKNEKIHEVQDALETIESNSERSMQGFETTTTGALTSPQGQNSGSAAFTSSASILVIKQPATTENPFSNSRRILYTDNTCSTIYSVYLAYFVDSGTLYERTIRSGGTSNGYSVNSSNTCVADTPWQRGSCTTAGADACQRADDVLATDVSAFSVTYPTPTTAKVSLTASKTVAGDAQTYTSSLIINSP